MPDAPSVFVDIDTQRDFLEPTGALYVPGSTEIVPRLAKLTRFARDHQDPGPGHGLRPRARRRGTEDVPAPLHDRHAAGRNASRRQPGPEPSSSTTRLACPRRSPLT